MRALLIVAAAAACFGQDALESECMMANREPGKALDGSVTGFDISPEWKCTASR